MQPGVRDGYVDPVAGVPAREEAVDYFRLQALAFFKRETKLRKDRDRARRKIMDLLEPNSLFGWEEPEPES